MVYRLAVRSADIATPIVDAIVSAANGTLPGGTEVNAAAGPELLTECHALGGCPTGEPRSRAATIYRPST
jgi:O-acetyl-ADP-ribose deacetylase